jgi:nitrite reductase/ring-hydroxylating ferredoxin subunit
MDRCTDLAYARSFHPHNSDRKEVPFGDGKVLISRLGDKIYATSAFCTHYGAPLAKGVLAADGRVVWCAISSVFIACDALMWVRLQPLARRYVR